MGLDIYVGSLARYYSGQWKTVIQQAAEQAGEKVEIVYSNRPQEALQHLESLNARTWRAKPEDIEEWETECPDAGAPLGIMARFAFALMLGLTRNAVEHRLPMRLDY